MYIYIYTETYALLYTNAITYTKKHFEQFFLYTIDIFTHTSVHYGYIYVHFFAHYMYTYLHIIFTDQVS